MVNSNNVTRKFTMKEKLASLGPGFVIVGSFIGPGTVTSCTLAGATYGFTLFLCVFFSVTFFDSSNGKIPPPVK